MAAAGPDRERPERGSSNRDSRAGKAPDYYQVLGIQPSASLEQIKAAFRRQALKYHPDKNSAPAATEHFKLCNDAHGVLTDAAKRSRYDWTREGKGVPELAREVIEDLLGAKRRRKRAGRDLRYTLELSFREAARGGTRRIRFPAMMPCRSCGGNGAAAGGTRPCPACHGKGESRQRLGLLTVPRPCPRCGGQGVAVVTACAACVGTGTLEEVREYEVRLQPGVEDGQVQVVRGAGELGDAGGEPGDLEVLVRVTPDALLRRDGADLRVTAPVAPAVAALGGALEVPSLEGRLRLKIPAGTQSGRVFRAHGKGLRLADRQGDLLITVEVETPVKLGAEERALLEAFQQRCTGEMLPRQREFCAKLEGLDEPEEPAHE